MKIAVYTLTRDRLAYTKACFSELREKAGISFDHFVVDNGSQDGTADWLSDELRARRLKGLTLNPANEGISAGSNTALEHIRKIGSPYDLVVKFDNDCFVKSENVLGQMAEIFESIGPFASRFVLSPRVEGINRQPSRGRMTQLAGRRIGLTAIVGGLFHCVPADVYRRYRYPTELPLASGQDDHFCHWFKDNGGEVGYVEGLIVEHYRGTDQQALDYPAYFERKWQEEKTVSR